MFSKGVYTMTHKVIMYTTWCISSCDITARNTQRFTYLDYGRIRQMHQIISWDSMNQDLNFVPRTS